jgi:hypothetical protein
VRLGEHYLTPGLGKRRGVLLCHRLTKGWGRLLDDPEVRARYLGG